VALNASNALLATRGLRAIADGLIAATFAALLTSRGFSETQLGSIITATLLGSAVLLVAISRRPDIFNPIRVLLVCAALMAVTGLTFGLASTLWLLLPVAIVGPLNPSGGDVSAFLPSEQALIADGTSAEQRTRQFARYSLAGFCGLSIGSALAGPVTAMGRSLDVDNTDGTSFAMLVYAAIGLVVGSVYLTQSRRTVAALASKPGRLVESRSNIRKLTALFALDSAGGGMVGNALIAAWLRSRFDLPLRDIGLIFAAASATSAASALLAPRLTRRFGLVETMVLTHIPAQLLGIAAGLAPSIEVAVGFLIARSLLSQLDVPPRQAFVMSIVTPSERAAAAAFTNLPRSLAAAATPPLAGWLLTQSRTGWPLVLGSALKLIYDGLLFVLFRRHSTKA
jgi:MFS family permease